VLARGIECGFPERVEQSGMGVGAQFHVEGIEGLSGLLVLVFGGAVEGGGNGGVAVRADGYREAENGNVYKGLLPGGSRRVQNADEQAVGAGGISVHEVDKPQVQRQGSGWVLVAMGFRDLQRLPEGRHASGALSGRDLVDTEIHQGNDESVVISGRLCQREDLLPVRRGCVPVTGLALERRAVAEGGGEQMGIPG
jgi:hypothetical protein